MGGERSRPAVFFDRDGVLVRSRVVEGRPHSARSLAELELIPAAIQLCDILRLADIPTFMITNQPDIARGMVTSAIVEEQNLYVLKTLGITDFAVCPHDDDDACTCRKPKPGMIEALSTRHNIDLEKSLVIGDRWRDIEAGSAVGAMTLFIDHNYSERKPEFPTRTVTTPNAMAQAAIELLSTIIAIHKGDSR